MQINAASAKSFRVATATVCLYMLAATTHAAEPTLLHVNTFPTARSLPFYVALDRGFFARHGLKVELEFTESSEHQREGLAGGTVDIVHSAVDNAVAMIDVAKIDIVIVSGGDSGTNEFYVQDTIKDFSDIRGKAIVVDATNTAYALQARKILAQQGLKDGTDYSLNPVGNGQPRPKACAASAAPPICSGPIRPAAPSCAASGRVTMRPRWKIISPPLSRRCAGRSIRTTTPRPRPFWWKNSSCRRTRRTRASP